MKRTFFSAVCTAVLIIVPAFGCAAAPQNSAATTGGPVTGDEIGRQIQADSTLNGQDVNVAVSDGVVTLTGTVATTEQRDRAGVLANVKGITRVVNQIVVNSAAVAVRSTTGAVEKAADKTKEGVEKAIDKTKEGLEKSKEGLAIAADKTSEGVRKAGSEVADALVLASVKTRLFGDEGLKGSDINVDSDAHVVTLRGTVPTAAARARAVELARKAEGVDRVVDRLTIGPKK